MQENYYKEFNREIDGYVEVLYDVKTADELSGIQIFYYENEETRVNMNTQPYTQELIDTIENNGIINDFSILYNNYVSLDGKFLLFNKFNNKCGYVSEFTPKEIYDKYYNGNGNSGLLEFNISPYDTIKGITIYFKDNFIKNATVEYYLKDDNNKKTIEINNNNSEKIYVDFNGDAEIVSILVKEWTNPERYVHVAKIDLGLSHIYKGSELIDFTITEQVDKLCEEAPNNELSLTIGDYDKLYDPLNPKGITEYLSENSKYIPYIGIKDKNGMTNYTKMGEFYFFNNDYKDKEVIITAYNLMAKLSKAKLENKNGTLSYSNYLVGENKMSEYLTVYLNGNYDYKHNITIENKTPFLCRGIKQTNLADFLQDLGMVEGLFYVDRDDTIILRNIDKTMVDKISKNELLGDINYKDEEKISSFNYSYYGGTIEFSTEDNDKDNFSTNITLEDNEQIICLTSEDPTAFALIKQEHITQTGANNVSLIKSSAYDYNDFLYMIFLKITGEKGKTVQIKGKTPKKVVYSFNNQTQLIKVNNDKKEPSFDLNNPLFISTLPIKNSKLPNFVSKFYNYKVSFDYNGNPNIKAGDYISVESNYGYVPIMVSKHTLKYNGGLSGSIEGVE